MTLPDMMPDHEFAPAKVNLALHVVGRRADGYHLLDSLVIFAGVGDRIRRATGPGLTISGPEGAGLVAGPDNLVLRAGALMGVDGGLHLDKHLPVSSGIGGGSADAAATLRLLERQGLALPDADAVLGLGADVPVCLAGRGCRMQGVGECITPLPRLPRGWMVLVNPRVAVSTPAVFRALASRDNPGLPDAIPEFADLDGFARWLGLQRNDMQQAAITIAPVIADVLALVAAQPGVLLARMSGSGATCFGLFADEQGARAACAAMAAVQPGWWHAAAPFGDGTF